MADLKLLTERVIEKEKSVVQQKIAESKEKARLEIEAAHEEAESEKEKRKKDIEAQLQQEYEISRNTLDVRRRNETLATKQRILTDVFEEAHTVLKNMDVQTLQSFLKSILEQFKGQGRLEVILAEETKEKISPQWLQSLEVEGSTVEVSEETLKGKSGIIVRKEGVEYNYLFDALIEDSKKDMIQEVSQQLFQ